MPSIGLTGKLALLLCLGHRSVSSTRHVCLGDQLGLMDNATSTGEYRQAVAGNQKLACHADSRHGILGGDLTRDPGNVLDRLRRPDDRHGSAWCGRGRVELAIGETQQPGPDFLMRHSTRVGFGNRHGRGQRPDLSLGFVVIGKGERLDHPLDVARWPSVCTCIAICASATEVSQ